MPRKPPKRGPGRPPLGAAGRSKVRTIKLTAAELGAQEAAATAESRTWSDWARAALDLAVARGSTR
jgi:hypothetical protein